MSILNTLNSYSTKKSKRVGRGIGSGKGKTCGKGHKGQKARTGCSLKIGFIGGQTPMQRTIPKMGFTCTKNKLTKHLTTKHLSYLNQNIEHIDMQVLKECGLIKKSCKRVRITNHASHTCSMTYDPLSIHISSSLREQMLAKTDEKL